MATSKRRANLIAKLAIQEFQRAAEEKREGAELMQPHWPFAEDELLFDVVIRDGTEHDECVIACTRKGTGDVVQRARPAMTAYDEAARLARRAKHGLIDLRRAR